MHAAHALAFPYFHLGSIGFIQSFGVIVAAGVIIGAEILRRYAEWHGVDDDHIRKLLAWVTICGFIGAHEFDMVAYNWDKIGEGAVNIPPDWWPSFLGKSLWPTNWPLPLKIWEGISSYGGFLGGAGGFAFYVWWKRLPVRLFADITITGLLPAFSIGRIGCTVVSDHIGSAVDPNAWYAFLAENYPRDLNMEVVQKLVATHPGTGPMTAWNLGLIEFLYLVPVNLFILWLAFRPPTQTDWDEGRKTARRLPAGFVTVLAGLFYAPVRFFLDFLRPDETDPRYLSLTFAQWASILAFAVAGYAALRIWKTGKAAEPIRRTQGEVHQALRTILKEEEGKSPKLEKQEPEKKAEPEPEENDDDDDDELAKEAEAAGKPDEDEAEDEAEDKPAPAAKPKSTTARPKQGNKNKGKKKKRR
jgi:phosphatidylglycerol:prolipoprotein diacylglycerol transferase